MSLQEQAIGFGLNTAQSLVGAGMGLLLEHHNDQRQLEMQQKLQDMQIRGAKEMSDYNFIQQHKMWEQTSYPAQIQMMQKAGLNPALMYGQGGGGGATTNVNPGTVSSSTPPSGGHEAMEGAAMGLQNAMSVQLLKAQTDVLESQAQKNKVEAAKTAGVDTEQTKANIESIWQGIDNARQQNTIQKLEITMKNIENFEKQASQEDRLDYIEYQTKTALRQLQIATNEATISGATVPERIKMIQQEAISSVLQNALTTSQTQNTQEQILLNREKYKEIANNILINWDKLGVDKAELQIKQQLQEFQTDNNREAIGQAIDVIKSIMHIHPPKITKIINY